jgi:CRISPR-associated protein Cas2
MLVVIAYDIKTKTLKGEGRLSRVAKICIDYGQRVQNSVFECDVDASELAKLKKLLLDAIDPENDSLRFYNLGNNYKKRIEHFGVKCGYDPEGFISF